MISTRHINSFYRSVLIFCIFFSTVISLTGQGNKDVNVVAVDNDPRKEEIQRYFGYEDLFFRYTTLPYDATMNNNESAVFLDIGFLYLCFLPLLFIFYLVRNKKIQIGLSLFLLLYLISCFYFSKIFHSNNTGYWTASQILQGATNHSDGVLTSACLDLYQLTLPLFDRLYELLTPIQWLNDLTYPFLFISFFLLAYLTTKIEKKRLKIASIVLVCFFFLFILLSAGIIWYGFLVLPLSLMIIFYFIENKESPINELMKVLLSVLSIAFLIMSYGLRVSNIQPTDAENEKGKNLLYPFIHSYALGHASEDETIETIYTNLTKALEDVNSNDALIYKVGTSINIHVKNNHTRLFSDNQLGIFYNLYRAHGKEKIFKGLREYGFGYLVIDLHTATIDRTPTQSLTQKFNILQEAVYDNPDLELLATDRIVRIRDNSGAEKNIYGLFGEPLYFGSYAVFKIAE